jgi:poly [ADP-ribose] polymerase
MGNPKPPSKSNFKVQTLFELSPTQEPESFNPSNLPNRHLLFHGARITDFPDILKNSLKVPNGSLLAGGGQIFGNGIYFSDFAAKATNRCHYNLSNNTGLLLICDVALGRSKEFMLADSKAASGLGEEFSSIIGRGKIFFFLLFL